MSTLSSTFVSKASATSFAVWVYKSKMRRGVRATPETPYAFLNRSHSSGGLLCRLTACLTTLSIFFADACTPNPCGDNAVCEGSATFAYCYCEPGYENTGSSSWGFAGGNFACTPIGERSLAATTRLRINKAVLSSPRGHRQPFAATATFAEPTNEARFRSAS